jgi:hypothetical protein
MAFYYVKNGGTATGDGGRYASQQTTSPWATEFPTTAEYYDGVENALAATTAPANGDFIIFSDLHSKTSTTARAVTTSTSGTGWLTLVSVDDAAITTVKAGATEIMSGTSADWTVTGRASHWGLTITGNDNIVAGVDSHANFHNCALTVTGSGDLIGAGSDGATMSFYDTTVTYDNTGGIGIVNNGCRINMVGGSVGAAGHTNFTEGGYVNGGGSLRLTGVDLTNISAASSHIVATAGGSPTGDDAIDVILEGCRISSSLADWVEEGFSAPNHEFVAVRCGKTSAAAEHQYYKKTWSGEAEDATNIIRNETVAFEDSGTKISIKVTTTSTASKEYPFVFDLPARWSALSAASTDTVRAYFAISNATTLHDDDVWMEVLYPDGTNKHLFNGLSNCPGETGTFVCDPLNTSTTAHTDDSAGSDWRDGGSALTAHNEYRMDVDTSGDPGADSVPIIRVHVSIPSVIIYFDPTVDLVA